MLIEETQNDRSFCRFRASVGEFNGFKSGAAEHIPRWVLCGILLLVKRKLFEEILIVASAWNMCMVCLVFIALNVTTQQIICTNN